MPRPQIHNAQIHMLIPGAHSSTTLKMKGEHQVDCKMDALTETQNQARDL